MEISDIVEKESTKLSLKEKIGLGLTCLASLPVVPYIYNKLIARPLESTEILTSIADHAGNVPHIFLAYFGGRFLEAVFNNGNITKTTVCFATAYYILGEVFHSEIASNLPQILPGNPDIKDIPLTIAAGLGVYLANKKL